ncbi:hypothetical protein L914_02942 [Phytophthora nicotianae]|uniref:Uncharacterized protein n=1 Tax=Phytophthora nicotianae TaxID=4792 RepID=W2NXW7_PHYNI|nr:hypothetical protein L914_02942 [Phytophthora nicotianae]
MSCDSSGLIDRTILSSLSRLVEKLQLTLTETIRLWRNESPEDRRPNKSMDPTWLDILLHGYRHRHCAVAVATFGVSHNFTGPRSPDTEPARNHASARDFNRALLRSIGDGQTQGTYLVLDLPVALRWSALRFSPFGCVPKKDVNPTECARLIHDLSYPEDSSINHCSTQSKLPDLNYESVRRIARRIEELAERHPTLKIKLLKGDEPFFSFVWVDDHILLEVDKGNRLALAEAALQLSMLAVLGPNAINEKKFSPWATNLDVLGLSWDTQERTISMPPDKVQKSLNSNCKGS